MFLSLVDGIGCQFGCTSVIVGLMAMDILGLIMTVYAKAFSMPRTKGACVLLSTTILVDFMPSLLLLTFVMTTLVPTCPTTAGIDGVCSEDKRKTTWVV